MVIIVVAAVHRSRSPDMTVSLCFPCPSNYCKLLLGGKLLQQDHLPPLTTSILIHRPISLPPLLPPIVGGAGGSSRSMMVGGREGSSTNSYTILGVKLP